MTAFILLVLTFLLTLVGAILYVVDFIGWAQFCWVLASGTAGAACAVLIEHRMQRDLQHDLEYWKNQPP